MARELDSGTRALVEDLQAKRQCFDRDVLIDRARKGRYHSFKSPHAAPECVLVRHLTMAGYADLAERVLEGRYDQPASESKAWAEETDEGRALTQATDASPTVRRSLDRLLNKASDPKFAAEARAFMMNAIRHRDFRHRIFRDSVESARN